MFIINPSLRFRLSRIYLVLIWLRKNTNRSSKTKQMSFRFIKRKLKLIFWRENGNLIKVTNLNSTKFLRFRNRGKVQRTQIQNQQEKKINLTIQCRFTEKKRLWIVNLHLINPRLKFLKLHSRIWIKQQIILTGFEIRSQILKLKKVWNHLIQTYSKCRSKS